MLLGLRRARAVLELERDNALKVLVRAKTVHAKMSSDPTTYANPPIPLATVGQQIVDLDAAQLIASSTRAKGAAAKRNVALGVLCTSLETYRSFVQGLADSNPEKAMSIIENAGLKVAASNTAVKPVIDARQNEQGTVVLRANASLLHKGASSRFFNWQYSTDGGNTWTAMPSTPIAETSISGLPALSTCAFRVSVTHRKGQSEWSQAVSLVLLPPS